MTSNTRSAQAFLDARDLLLRHRTDYERAYREFEWPKLDTFNWALDYFDVIARGNDNSALWIVDDPAGGGTRLSFAQMAERSSRMANFLREHGVARGDRLLLMLPNRVELWDVMLAAMKLGAVVLPATTQLSPDDVRERVEAGGARFVIVDAAELAKFDALDASVKRIAVGARPDEAEGWIDLGRAYDASASFEPDGPTNATDPLLLYFTSGTRRSRSSSSTRTRATRSAICRRCTGSGCNRATCTGTSARRAGRNTRGAASSRHGMRRRACSSTTTRASCRRTR